MNKPSTAVFRTQVTAWFNEPVNSPYHLETALKLCAQLPQAKVFVSYAKCYSKDKALSEAARYLAPYRIASSIPGSATVPVAFAPGSPTTVPGGFPQGTPAPVPGAFAPLTTVPGGFPQGTPGSPAKQGTPRPAHFDSWLHLMPSDLQAKVLTVKSLLTSLADTRRQLESLAANPRHSKADLSRLAKLCVNSENRALNIFAQADACWEEITGRDVSPETKKLLLQEESKLSREFKKLSGSTSPSAGGAPSPTPASPSAGCAPAPASPSAGGVTTPKPAPSPSAGGAPAPAPASPSAGGVSTPTEKELSSLSYTQLLALPDDVLPEGQRTHWIKRRLEYCQKYIRDKLPDNPNEQQRERAIACASDLFAFKGKLSRKVSERLDALGIQFPIPNS